MPALLTIRTEDERIINEEILGMIMGRRRGREEANLNIGLQRDISIQSPFIPKFVYVLQSKVGDRAGQLKF